jgi:Ca2+:H+ antiporter
MDNSIRDTSGVYRPWVDSLDSHAVDKEAKLNLENQTFWASTFIVAKGSPLNVLLVCVPISLITYWSNGSKSVVFSFGLLALAPLAERISYITEQLGMHTNDTIGGLLNVTFGNSTELIVSICALQRGLHRLVQLSLLGSILSNMLLVLGCAFFAGGFYNKVQRFGTLSSLMNSTLLMLSVFGVLLPTILTTYQEESNLGELGYSRGTSVVLFVLYFSFVYFQVS